MMAAHDSITVSWSLNIFALFHDFAVGLKFFQLQTLTDAFDFSRRTSRHQPLVITTKR